MPPTRSTRADCLYFLTNVNTEIRAGVIRDIETQNDMIKRERERGRERKDKERNGKTLAKDVEKNCWCQTSCEMTQNK